MAPRRQIKGTYSKVKQNPVTEEERRRRYKQRRHVPQFNNLFVPKDENQESVSSQDTFDAIFGEMTKPADVSVRNRKSRAFRKPLAVNSLLTNSTFGSACHSSANDTFDKFIGGSNKLAVCKTRVNNGCLLSSSNSSFDTTGILYQSLRSHTQSNLHCSTDVGSKSQFIKEKKQIDDSKKAADCPSVILENNSITYNIPVQDKNQLNGSYVVPLSPQLFSSIDEKQNRLTVLSGQKKRKSKLATKVRKAVKSGTREKKGDRREKQSDYIDISETGETVDSSFDCDNFAATGFASPDTFKKPSVTIGQPTSACTSPEVEEKGVLTPNQSWEHFHGFTGTPCASTFAKVILHKHHLSQNKLSITSQPSRGSQGSGKSSIKSDVLTSTPADESRLQTVTNSISPWNITNKALFEHTISPVPRESISFADINMQSVFQSPMSFKTKSSVPSYQSGTNPSQGSHYHTCFSDECRGSGCGKTATEPSKSEEGKQDCCKGSNNITNDVAVSQGFYNSSLEIKNGPFKGATIPVFDPTGGIQTEASKGQSLQRSVDEFPNKEASAIEALSNIQTSPKESENQQKVAIKSDGILLQEMSKNFSSEKLKQINSFLNRPSFILPRRTRQQKAKFSKNRVEPLPVVKRLTRRATRISSNVYQKENVITDQSTTTEPSFVLTRRGKNVITDQSTATESSFVLPRRKNNFITDQSTATEPSFVLPKREIFFITDQSTGTESSFVLPRRKKNVITDQSTGTESSFVMPRRKKTNFSKKLNSWRLSHLKREKVNSSKESVSTDCSFILSRGNTANYAAASNLAKSSPALTRRSSVRLAAKRKTDVRSSARSEKSFESNINIRTSSRLLEKAYISTRSTAKRLQKAKKLSIMQFSLSSVKSEKADLEESRFSVASNNTVSDNGSSEEENSQPNDSYSELSAVRSFSLQSEHFENRIIKEESEYSDNVLSDNTLPNIEGNSQAKYPPTPTLKTTKVSIMEDDDLCTADMSTGEVYELPFQAAVPAKRGKGWIRSLSIARASIIGDEQIREMNRRQTVHRMSVSTGIRRITQLCIPSLPEMTCKIIEEIEDFDNERKDNLSHHTLYDPRRHVLTLCSQVEPVPITNCFTESRLSCCKKIGEGVYGEVFMTKPNPNSMDDATVLKIMPIEGDFDVNGEPQKKFEEILSEIIISVELSNLRKAKEGPNWTESFVHVLNCWCVEGNYHQDMLHLWDLFHEEKGSENDRPDIFPESQLYIVLEFTHGGRDLEGFVFNNAGQALAVFLQIAYSLAVAEQELEFEHRDLHWGNVLVATTKESSVDFKISGATYSLQTQGVKATVIDFTLSRLKAPHCVMYNNLAEDPSLFTAQGDYQFEIYRQMKKANRNDWESFTPYTNVLWLHYILDKMINECYYKNDKSKVHKINLDQLNKLKQTMLDSESATAFVFRRELDL